MIYARDRVFDHVRPFVFQSHVWGMKREPIKTPFLHKSKDADYMDSIAIFKLILRFMNDESLSPKREQALADYIIHKVRRAFV